MYLETVLSDELKRNANMQKSYLSKIGELPKGTLILKKNYVYLKYRVKEKVHTDYVGKDEDKIAKLAREIDRRKHFELMLSELKKEQKVISKMLEGIK